MTLSAPGHGCALLSPRVRTVRHGLLDTKPARSRDGWKRRISPAEEQHPPRVRKPKKHAPESCVSWLRPRSKAAVSATDEARTCEARTERLVCRTELKDTALAAPTAAAVYMSLKQSKIPRSRCRCRPQKSVSADSGDERAKSASQAHAAPVPTLSLGTPWPRCRHAPRRPGHRRSRVRRVAAQAEAALAARGSASQTDRQNAAARAVRALVHDAPGRAEAALAAPRRRSQATAPAEHHTDAVRMRPAAGWCAVAAHPQRAAGSTHCVHRRNLHARGVSTQVGCPVAAGTSVYTCAKQATACHVQAASRLQVRSSRKPRSTRSDASAMAARVCGQPRGIGAERAGERSATVSVLQPPSSDSQHEQLVSRQGPPPHARGAPRYLPAPALRDAPTCAKAAAARVPLFHALSRRLQPSLACGRAAGRRWCMARASTGGSDPAAVDRRGRCECGSAVRASLRACARPEPAAARRRERKRARLRQSADATGPRPCHARAHQVWRHREQQVEVGRLGRRHIRLLRAGH